MAEVLASLFVGVLFIGTTAIPSLVIYWSEKRGD